MQPIEFLSVTNVISRRDDGVRQELQFRLLVQHFAYEKIVDVHWAGEDGVWRILAADWVCFLGPRQELWYAQISVPASGDGDRLPGDIRFAAHCRMAGQDFWDNNCGFNHEINADSGIRLSATQALLHTDFNPRLDLAQDFLPVTVALHPAEPIRHVFVRWSRDRWRTFTDTPCYFKRRHWDRAMASNARNPNRYGNEVWINHLAISGAFRVEYAIACETEADTIWDDNFGHNYLARRDRLKVLTLNLHCNQEENQDAKLSLIAQVIRELEIDIVCFQEVSEPWNEGRGQWDLNTAHIIRERLGRPYHLHQDWSHLGFGRYREGSAILSRHTIVDADSGYVSTSQDPLNIHARRVVRARINVPYIGPVNVFSCHLSWINEGFREQLPRLRQWANTQQAHGAAATLLCGDFNVAASSEGYVLATRDGNYSDQFLQAQIRQRHAAGLGPPFEGGEQPQSDDGRIDYVFAHRDGHLEAVAARELFTDTDYGRVSDHPGYLVEFEPC